MDYNGSVEQLAGENESFFNFFPVVLVLNPFFAKPSHLFLYNTSSVVYTAMLLIYCCIFIACINVLILLYTMGVQLLFIQLFCSFFQTVNQIKNLFFNFYSKEKHM